MNQPRIMIAAPRSGGGKTTVTCGLLRALQRRGHVLSAFKCGPDYIDPMFHRNALQVKTGNLDSYFTDVRVLRGLFARRAKGTDLSVIEGVMGYYDGLGGMTESASSREIADMTETPVILVADAKGVSVSLVPMLAGLIYYHEPTRIAGMILNRCSAGFYGRLKGLIEQQIDVPVLGYLPERADLAVSSRHLGLISPEELEDRRSFADRVADQLEKTVDLDAIEQIARSAPELKAAEDDAFYAHGLKKKAREQVRIAYAADEAFSFTYAENEELLQELGAELVPFSPLHDTKLPDNIGGMILCGGYPELYRRELAENRSMLEAVKEALLKNLPTIAECGGFMYLMREMEGKDKETVPMAGAISGKAYETSQLVRFGYCEGITKTDGLFGKAGTILRGHEFHYWDTTENGSGFLMTKPISSARWEAVEYSDTKALGFPHFYYAGCPEAAEAFLDACRMFQRGC